MPVAHSITYGWNEITFSFRILRILHLVTRTVQGTGTGCAFTVKNQNLWVLVVQPCMQPTCQRCIVVRGDHSTGHVTMRELRKVWCRTFKCTSAWGCYSCWRLENVTSGLLFFFLPLWLYGSWHISNNPSLAMRSISLNFFLLTYIMPKIRRDCFWC